MQSFSPERVCAFVLVTLLSCTMMAAHAEMKPWLLRDHYSFSGDTIMFRVDPKNAEWNAATRAGTNLIDTAYTEIELADGRVARLTESNWITEGRDEFRDGFGSGTRFRSEFKPLDGLHVEYHVNRYSNHAFLTVMLIVRNTNPAPLGLKAIRLGVIDEGLLRISDESALLMHHADRRGTHLVPTDANQMSLVKVSLPDGQGVLGIGLLQSGYMESAVRFEQGAEGWGGVVESVYDPPIEIAARKTAQSDALWVMTSGPNAQVQRFHDWAEGYIMPRMVPKNYPSAWVTVPRDGAPSDLLSAAGQLRIDSVSHALVPAWYNEPSEIPLDRLAEMIRGKRMVPGLTVDPLLAPRSSKGFTIPGQEGLHWVDLRIPEAREYGVSNLRKFIKWKYQFFAIQESEIPDGVLREMNITRSVADVVAFELMEEAAGELPVMPSSQLVLGNDEAGWSRVAVTTRKNSENQVLTGPTRLDVRGIEALTPGVVSSISQVEGPIEIVGVPSNSVKKQLDGAVRSIEGLARLETIGNE